jgi:hypothetical protein
MKRALFIIAALTLSTTVVLAAEPAPGQGPRAACKADVEKLCRGVQPGHGRIAACLKQNEAQVSAACKEAIANASQRHSTQGSAAPQGQ